MGRRIELPQLPKGEAQEQLQALYSYLYRMAEALNNNLAEIGNGDFTDEEMVTVREIVGQDETAQGAMAEAETLKSLIIKTAQLIKNEIDAYNLKLIGTYTAEGKLGRYVRKTRLDVDVTPTGITQNYTFQDIIQGLKTYEVNAKNYIKTGLLRTVSSVPVYGVAIGKDVVTFSEDGTETYNDGNKVAELTADELSFWQSGNKVASYTGTAITLYSGATKRMLIDGNGVKMYDGNTLLAEFLPGGLKFYYNGTLRTQMDTDGVKIYDGSTLLAELLNSALKFYYNGTLRTQMDTDGVKIYDGSTLLMKITGSRISFYYNGNEVFYILNGKMYAAGDMEIKSGNTFKIVSGGVIDIDTNNFKIDSANRKIQSNKIKLDDNGITYTDNDYNIKIGKFSTVGAKDMAAVMADMDSSYNGSLKLVASPGTTSTNATLELQCLKRSYDNTYARRLLFKGNGTADSVLGCDDYSGGIGYAQIGTIVAGSQSLSGDTYGGIFEIIFDPFYNPLNQSYVPNSTPKVEISHNEAIHNGAMRVYYFNNAGGSDHIRFVNSVDFSNAITAFSITGTNITYTNLYQSSSKDIKHDIQDMEPKGEQLDRLRPVTFVYDDDPEEKVRAGLIYEEAAEVMPEICTGDEGSKAINYVEMIPMLLKEIQELRARVKALEEREGGN